MKRFLMFLKDEEGAAAVEYGILVAAIAATIVILVYQVGDKVKAAFDTVKTQMENPGGGGGGN
jgi:pilus assembly protein Flp/PilA